MINKKRKLMSKNNAKNTVEENKIKLSYQLDAQSKQTLERLAPEKIRQSIAGDIEIFQNHKVSIRG